MGGISLIRGSQFGALDGPAVRIDGKVQPLPALARLATVLLMQPVARAEHLQRQSRSGLQHSLERHPEAPSQLDVYNIQ
jgi:hypothetical protein